MQPSFPKETAMQRTLLAAALCKASFTAKYGRAKDKK